MQKIKTALLKVFYYIFILPFIWIISKFDRKNPRDDTLMKELRKANEENDKRLEVETLSKIESMPSNYRDHFSRLNITGLQFFLATHAIESLIRRYGYHRNLPNDIGVLFGPAGTIGFGKTEELLDVNLIELECGMIIPASTTRHEIMRFVQINEETAKNTILFIACSLHYCDTLIPNFRAVATTATTGILQSIEKK